MSSLEIQPVVSGRQRRAFLHLPWDLYKGDPNWIPPLRQNQKELVGFARHPFYDAAEGQAFLAVRDGRPVGRVLAILNKAHNRHYDARDGFFGFFESIDDADVTRGLFDAARAWVAERGMTTLRGPVNPSLNYEIGLLVEGFDSPPAIMMTYNPPHYMQLIEGAGFTKLKDAYAFWGHVDMLDTLDEKLDRLARDVVERFKVSMRRMDHRRFGEEVKEFLNIYNRSLVNTWGFVPFSDAEVQHLSKGLKHLLVPELTIVAEIDKKPIGVMLAIPDYNPRIKRIDGRLFPFGVFRLLYNRRAITKARVVSANVLPEFQQWGVGLALMAELEREIVKTSVQEAEFSWVLEDNHLSRRSLEHGGAIKQKTYRIYECPVA
jgi:GNAT superfamily N-acetyltransferase